MKKKHEETKVVDNPVEHDNLPHTYGEPLITPPPPEPITLHCVHFETFDFQNEPLGTAMGKLGDLKRFYDRCAQIVLARQQTSPKIRKCFTMETQRHPEGAVIPRVTKQNCRRDIPDGKELSRDDGAYEIIDGIKVLRPAVCCSVLCDQFYKTTKPLVALSRH